MVLEIRKKQREVLKTKQNENLQNVLRFYFAPGALIYLEQMPPWLHLNE